MPKYAGNIPVIPTPFYRGKIDYDSFDRLFDAVGAHLDGYVVCGSTGEAPSMTTEERIAAIAYAAKRVPQEQTLVVGLGHTSLEDAVRIGAAARDQGIASALVPSPYYFPNSIGGIIDFIGKLADRTGLELVFYDNPVTTGTKVTTDDLIAIATAVPAVKAVKMTDHSFEKIRNLKERTALNVFGGDDIICFRSFVAGVDGNMIIAPIIFPEAFKACWEAFRAGRFEESYDIYSRVLLPFISMFGPGDEIPTTKFLFEKLGLFRSGEVRTPLLAPTPIRQQEVWAGYQQGRNCPVLK